MQKITHRYPGHSSEEIFERVRTGLWARRREISHHDIIDKILGAVKWDTRRLRGGGSKRVLLVKSSAEIRVVGDEVQVELDIPFKNYEQKYCERVGTILESLFD